MLQRKCDGDVKCDFWSCSGGRFHPDVSCVSNFVVACCFMSSQNSGFRLRFCSGSWHMLLRTSVVWPFVGVDARKTRQTPLQIETVKSSCTKLAKILSGLNPFIPQIWFSRISAVVDWESVVHLYCWFWLMIWTLGTFSVLVFPRLGPFYQPGWPVWVGRARMCVSRR